MILISATVKADEIEVEEAKLAGPYTICEPVVLDSITLAGKKFSADQALNAPVSLDAVKTARLSPLPIGQEQGTLNLLGFTVSTSAYTAVEVKVEGPSQKKVYIDGTEQDKTSLPPGQYDIVVKYIADTADVRITVNSDKEGAVTLKNDNTKRAFNLDDNMEMKHYYDISLSPSGKYLISRLSYFDNKGETQRENRITEVATGRIISDNVTGAEWMPQTDKYYKVKEENGRKRLFITDPATGKSETIASDLPTDNFVMAPTEDYLIYYIENEGPKKQEGVYEVVHPDDRQPNYRHRYSLGHYDLKSGLAQPITYGYHNTWLEDISCDGRYLLFSVSLDSITTRPSELQSTYILDLSTMKATELIHREGFTSGCLFYPNSTNKLIIKGSPEAFGGIGRNLPADMTPSMCDYQLFSMDLPSKKVTPLTINFNPSVDNVTASENDGMIYFSAENADSVSLYMLDPATDNITMITQPMEVVGDITISRDAPLMMISGTSACIPDRIYSVSLGKKKQVTLVEDLNKERMSEIALGQCLQYSFSSSKGYRLTGHYYLPADFDKSRKYPVIVDYYGGCSPTSLRFGGGSHYPAHYWNALGYVVLVVNPSGATGFGQEWAARHVNTAGEGVAEDIIEATQWFADNNSWVNREKIGCVSASYGGFMTQVLLSKTDLYACGISHAGISSHTSYWGEGYWGYSYSEVSMANSYPWNRRDLYVDRSPIYNADKIHTPILFTHGTADTNVPPGESIQMYTAMKILGVPTAFVMVEDENHGIMDYAKRKKWINTMMAWFQRWLQDDDSWWRGMYTEVSN